MEPIVTIEEMTLLGFLDMLCNHNKDISDEDINKFLLRKFDEYIKDVRKLLNQYYKIKKKASDYRYEDIAQIIFDSKYIGDDSEAIDTHIKNCLIGILRVLDETKKDVLHFVGDGRSICREVLIGRCHYYYSLIFHIQEYKEHVESYKTQIGNRNHVFRSQITAQQTLYLAFRLPRNEIYYNDIAQAPVAAFLLRQSIELKILEILGIRYIWNNKTNKPQKMTADVFIPLIFSDGIKYYKSVFQSEELEVSKTLLEKVHAWANPYVHMGNMQYLWEVEIARQAIVDFVLAIVEVPEDIKEKIPEMALQKVDEEDRSDCEVIMRK